MKRLSVVAAAVIGLCSILGSAPGFAQQKVSKLTTIPQRGTIRVCQNPSYYSISFRNPKTGELEGIDVDLSKEFAKDLNVKLEIVGTNFASSSPIFRQTSAISECLPLPPPSSLKRAQAVEFSDPYLESGLYAVVHDGSKIQKWEDIDQDGVRVVTTLGSFMDENHEGLPEEGKTAQRDAAHRRAE